jgi:hypothetical protein
MTRRAIAVAVLAALAAAGCVRLGGAASAGSSSASDVGDLAGRWQGSVFETGAYLVQGNAAVDVVLGADGTWRGTIGKMTASGTATRRRGLLVLDGFASSPDGRWQSVYYALQGDGSLRWGEITTPFNGVREEHALVALRKTP